VIAYDVIETAQENQQADLTSTYTVTLDSQSSQVEASATSETPSTEEHAAGVSANASITSTTTVTGSPDPSGDPGNKRGNPKRMNEKDIE
jgi:hypothetical protein